eukprot:TRINITY_DN36576_c0_g1_i1.p1 TRINITY_DN36576_c0_g1~~TRINITY_DN36576_c0_g1_i1.p1  ORF type:complete len:459 (-),score=66.01 TRINITY_DN36576_c0_g1_i1:135-1475(-)
MRPRPQAIPCPSCGELYLPWGLRFHAKKCKQTPPQAPVRCPYCQLQLPPSLLESHTACCAARPAVEGASLASAAADKQTSPDVSEAFFDDTIMEDGRHRCQFCGRGFTSDRIQAHRNICSRLQQARPASLGGIHTQLPQRVYSSTLARSEQSDACHQRQLFVSRELAENQGIQVRNAGMARKIGSSPSASLTPWRVLGVDRQAGVDDIRQAFERLAVEWDPSDRTGEDKALAEAKFAAIAEARDSMTRLRTHRRQQPAGDSSPAPKSWRTKHQSLVEAVRSARTQSKGEAVAGGGTDVLKIGGGVTCPHCLRCFGDAQARRHILRCAYIVNRPRAPPPRPQPLALEPGGVLECIGQGSPKHRSRHPLGCSSGFLGFAGSALGSSAAGSPLRAGASLKLGSSIPCSPHSHAGSRHYLSPLTPASPTSSVQAARWHGNRAARYLGTTF